MDNTLEKCNLCPRRCGINRMKGQTGVCNVTDELKVARAALHYWEEPCISGEEGSGTIFFSGCALHCVYCQNHEIANGSVGKLISVERLSEIMLELQESKANNINLVTPGHYAPQLVRSIELARANGLRIPILYNTGSYENADTIKLLDGLVDIYLPDFKYMDKTIAEKYSHAKDYPEVAKAAIAEMVRQTGKPVFKDGNEDGILERGTVVRHLALPGYMYDSKRIIKYLYDTYGDRIYISIMNQYTPLGRLSKYPELNRRLTEAEYEELIDYAIEIGVEQGFVQEGDTALESFIPDFNCEGV